MNVIGAVNNTCDSLSKQKDRQALAHPGRKKTEQSADNKDTENVKYPQASDPDSMMGHLLDTSA